MSIPFPCFLLLHGSVTLVFSYSRVKIFKLKNKGQHCLEKLKGKKLALGLELYVEKFKVIKQFLSNWYILNKQIVYAMDPNNKIPLWKRMNTSLSTI